VINEKAYGNKEHTSFNDNTECRTERGKKWSEMRNLFRDGKRKGAMERPYVESNS